MSDRDTRRQRIDATRLIAVIRARSADQVLPMSRALVDNGITALEITTTTPGWAQAISNARSFLGGDALVGAGTVLDCDMASAAIEAGAEFLVSPIGRAELVPAAHTAGLPVMLGAFTPTECVRVQESGADYVKLFPADTLGPKYLRAIRAPLPSLRLVPTGGVEPGNVADFLDSGAVAVGIGSGLLTAEILAKDDWQALGRLARRFREAVDAGRRTAPNPYLRGEDRWRR